MNKIMTEAEQIEFLQAIGKYLSEIAVVRKFDPKEVHLVKYNDETYEVGPFVKSTPSWSYDDDSSLNSLGDDAFVWQLNPASDKYVLYALEENWDSWGQMYADFGLHFEIGQIIKYVPVIAYTNIDVPNQPKQKMRW